MAGTGLYILWELFPEKGFSRSLGLGISFSSDGGQIFVPAVSVPGTYDPNGTRDRAVGDQLWSNPRLWKSFINGWLKRLKGKTLLRVSPREEDTLLAGENLM